MSVKNLKYLLYVMLALIICYKLMSQAFQFFTQVADSNNGLSPERSAQMSGVIEKYIDSIQPSDSEPSVDLDGLYGEHFFSDLSYNSPLEALRAKLDKEAYSTKGVALGRSKTPNLIDSDGLGLPTYYTRGATLLIKVENESYGVKENCHIALDQYDSTRLFVTSLCLSKSASFRSNSAGVLTLNSPLKGAAKELFGSKAMKSQLPKEMQGLWSAAKESCGNVDHDDSLFVGGTSVVGEVEYDDIQLNAVQTSEENGLITISGVRENYGYFQVCTGTMEKMSEHYYATLSCNSSSEVLDNDLTSGDILKFVLCDKITPKSLKKYKQR